MNFEVDSGKIFKIAAGVLCLIMVILFISFITGKTGNANEITSIVLERRILNMTPGDEYKLGVIISPSDAKKDNITYTSNNPSIATIDESGLIKANSTGRAIIVVMSANGKQDQCEVNVLKEQVPVTSIAFDKDDITLTEGESTILKLTVSPIDTTEHNYTWTSSDSSVATVANGKITALKEGSTLITVMTKNKKIAICNVEVLPKVSSITFDSAEKTVSIGKTLTLNPTLAPKGTNASLNWESSDPNVAIVSDGVVTGLQGGETLITASSGSVRASIKIKVKIVTTSDIYTFKYPENQMSKPLMGCNTYTAADRTRLEDQLKRAIERVGYGTRAGVVEAARFLVGALDYRVPYVGPKKAEVDPTRQLGIYPRVGLNIGNYQGWGCQVSGWRQGMDCNNFVIWAFKQNGITINDYYSTNNTYPSRQVVNQIRPGDLMLSPCYSSCRFEGQVFSHVGIVIGVDETKIYIAEATTGDINSIVISPYEKNNMPEKYKFATARLYNYPAEGKLTDMWD